MPPRAADSALVKLLSTLDEAQKRWFVGREAMLLGHGGVKRMSELQRLVPNGGASGDPGGENQTPLAGARAGSPPRRRARNPPAPGPPAGHNTATEPLGEDRP